MFGYVLANSHSASVAPPTRWTIAKNSEETKSMMTFVLNSLARLHKDEEGQGLVEYLLILALVAFAATAGMGSLASYLNVAFSDVGSLLNAYIS
jgi:pilus assembly protein Flp/PilA